MNSQTKLTLSILMGTGAVAHSIMGFLRTHRQAKREREQIKHNSELDLQAIRRAGDQFTEELKSGALNGLSLSEMLIALNQRIEFEKIAIRLED